MLWRTRLRTFDLSHRALLMGVLNVTPDSFSDGGKFHDNVEAAVAHGLRLAAEGAEILDIGGESARPGAPPVSPEEEARRVLPVIRELRERLPEISISIDTMKAEVAAAAVEAGADIVNDIQGLHGPGGEEMARVAAETGAGLVVMHMQGTPQTMQLNPRYDDVVAEVKESLAASLEKARAAGVAEEAVVVDPGICFGKNLEHNLTLLRRLNELGVGGRPVLLGVSRKSFLGRLTGVEEPAARLWSTVAVTALARRAGARVLRVHDVRENREALRVAEAILGGGPEA